MSGYWGFIVLFFVLLTIPAIIILARTVVKNTSFKFKYPGIVLFVSIMFLCALLTPPLYAMGFCDEGRILDMFYISSIFVLYFDVFYVTCYFLVNVIDENVFIGKMEYSLLEKTLAYAVIILLFAGCISNSWAYKATVSIVSGEAKQYESEMYDRYNHLINADDEVVLPIIKTKPELLFFNEIAEAPDTWPNTDLEKYFDVDRVYLETYFK